MAAVVRVHALVVRDIAVRVLGRDRRETVPAVLVAMLAALPHKEGHNARQDDDNGKDNEQNGRARVCARRVSGIDDRRCVDGEELEKDVARVTHLHGWLVQSRVASSIDNDTQGAKGGKASD